MVPRLDFIAEEQGDAFDVDFPGGVEAGVVDGCEATDGGGEVTGVADGAVEEVGELFRVGS